MTAEPEVARPIRPAPEPTSPASSQAATGGTREPQQAANEPQRGSGANSVTRESTSGSDRGSAPRVPREQFALNERLTNSDESGDDGEAGEAEQQAEPETTPTTRAPGSPYVFQLPTAPEYTAPTARLAPPTTGIGGGSDLSTPGGRLNSAPSTGIGGGLGTPITPQINARPSTGIGGGTPGGNLGIGQPSTFAANPSGLPASGFGPVGTGSFLNLAPVGPQGIPLDGTLPASQRPQRMLPGNQQQFWPNYAPLTTLPPQSLNGLPGTIGQPGLNPPGLNPPRLSPSNARGPGFPATTLNGLPR